MRLTNGNQPKMIDASPRGSLPVFERRSCTLNGVGAGPSFGQSASRLTRTLSHVRYMMTVQITVPKVREAPDPILLLHRVISRRKGGHQYNLNGKNSKQKP